MDWRFRRWQLFSLWGRRNRLCFRVCLCFLTTLRTQTAIPLLPTARLVNLLWVTFQRCILIDENHLRSLIFLLSKCWFKSQVETSSTYGGLIAGMLTGGLNFQVEHHLFPRMSSAWYPYIAPTVRRVCKKHGVRYAYYPWVWQNLWSTFKYMHQAGTGANWDLEPLCGRS